MDGRPDDLPGDAVESFLKEARAALGAGDVDLDRREPGHRRLRVVVAEDRLSAHLEAVFPATTYDEVAEGLRRSRVVHGILEDDIRRHLATARRLGRAQRDVPVARGREAVYVERREVTYPFLDGLADPETGDPVHLASGVFREIADVMARDDVERIRGYARPVVAVDPGQTLMRVQGEDRVEPGCDVHGKVVRTVSEEGPLHARAGDGVELRADGSAAATRFGYVSMSPGGGLSVVSPIWISPDGLAAYFVNPPQLGDRRIPGSDAIVRDLADLGVTNGIDSEAIAELCRDLGTGGTRESCVRIARATRPTLTRGQVAFTFDPIPEARFEAIQAAMRSLRLDDVLACSAEVHAVHADATLAEQAEEGDDGPARDLFGEPLAPSADEPERRTYSAGVNVRREEQDGRVRYVSDIYGYVGVVQDRITVVSPIWVSPDRMEARFVALPQGDRPVAPTPAEVTDLLSRAKVVEGVDPSLPGDADTFVDGAEHEARSVLLARGTPAVPGQRGQIELFFERPPEPGAVLEGGAMDFRERQAIPTVEAGQLLAKRLLPTPGTPGVDVRGRVLKAPREERGLLFAGSNVTSKEAGREQFFHATAAGFARVSQDTLAVHNKLRHRGDVDYAVGNIDFDGDVEISGTVRGRFRVEAAGDVYVDGVVEKTARLVAGGDVVVRGGIVGSVVRARGSVFAKFIQDARVDAGRDLLVRNYVRDSDVRVGRRATVQGNDGGKQQLCMMGGTLLCAWGLETGSLGTRHGRKTHVIAGVNPEVEERLQSYRQGLVFCDQRSKQAMRGLGAIASTGKDRMLAAIRDAGEGRRGFLIGRLQELQKLAQLKESLEHHLEELSKQRADLLAQAAVKVTGHVFPNVTVQIGDAYHTLTEEQMTMTFRLNDDGDAVTQSTVG